MIREAREEVVQLSLRLDSLRQQRRELDEAIGKIERSLDAAISSAPDEAPAVGLEPEFTGRESEFTRHVLRCARSLPEVTVRGIASRERLDAKRVHNAMRTLERHRLVARVGRGRWRANVVQGVV